MQRSVANLNTEQLYRKRAFDRANQRATRARKKTRIQELEDEVRELQQQLAQFQAHVKRLQENETYLRQIIQSARVSLQMIDHQVSTTNASEELASPSSCLSNLHNAETEDIDNSIIVSSSSPNRLVPVFDEVATRSTVNEGSDCGRTTSRESMLEVSHQSDGVTLRDANTGLSMDLPITPSNAIFDLWSSDIDLDHNLGNVFSVTFSPATAARNSSTAWPSTDGMELLNGSASSGIQQLWECLPLHVQPTCRLDTVILEIMVSSRAHLQTSGQFPETSFPSIASLLNPSARDSQNPISNALGQHGKVSMEIVGSAERVACLYYLGLYLQWLIAPTKRNFEAMPEFLRPIPSQLTTAHPIWVDSVVWFSILKMSRPTAREKIIERMEWSKFERFRKITSDTLSINWPYDVSSILHVVSQCELQLNPVFVDHVRNLANWTVGVELIEEFPFLDCIPTK
ncbi:hypothetical protein IQ07DRAFT_632071 [Pyrenochaeta sp. DS3sAY3a]|nr:hypothetical protein IQ07DRAFT_632071 [Pyrenochaeta sp. DS3sAY3a]